jgi:thiol:disulfide interchange protein
MTRTLLALVIAAGAAAAWPAAAANEPPKPNQEPTAKAPLYDSTADAKAQIAAAVARAAKDNKRVLIQWGAEWCGWCHLLHATFTSDPAVKKQLAYEYEVVHVDIGRWDKNMDLAASYGADLKASGVPFLTVLDAQGKPVANQETGSLELKNAPDDKPGHDPAAVLAFLKKHQAPPITSDELMRAALSKAGAENKRVFLHFGAPWCGWCHRLENWMEKPEVAPILAKAFVDLKIDVDRNPGGKALCDKMGAGKSGIPWIAILDAEGKTLTTSEAPGSGNVGFPYGDEEIAWFIRMLKESTNLSTEDLATLEASLKANRDKK